MYVETDRNELRALKLPDMDSIAEFSENNVAQVTEHDGEILIAEVDHITQKQ